MSETEPTFPAVPEPAPAGTLARTQLRREALLPAERARGLGTVAIVCTMAGVASGLALATTLMAMQVADSMSTRSDCPYHQRYINANTPPPDHAYLGISYIPSSHGPEISGIFASSPAAAVGLHIHDHVVAIDGTAIHSNQDMQSMIFDWRAGQQPTLVVERDGHLVSVHPTLVEWPHYRR